MALKPGQSQLQTIARLHKIWLDNPTMRLGQLIENVFHHAGPHACFFYMDDEEFIGRIEEFYEDLATHGATAKHFAANAATTANMEAGRAEFDPYFDQDGWRICERVANDVRYEHDVDAGDVSAIIDSLKAAGFTILRPKDVTTATDGAASLPTSAQVVTANVEASATHQASRIYLSGDWTTIAPGVQIRGHGMPNEEDMTEGNLIPLALEWGTSRGIPVDVEIKAGAAASNFASKVDTSANRGTAITETSATGEAASHHATASPETERALADLRAKLAGGVRQVVDREFKRQLGIEDG